MTTSNVVRLPERDSITSIVAGNVRAEMGRAQMTIVGLRSAVGGSYAYWHRRLNGVTPIDVEDLATLAQFFACDPADFLPTRAAAGSPGPWAPSGSNRRPTDYKDTVRDYDTLAEILPLRRPCPSPVAALVLAA